MKTSCAFLTVALVGLASAQAAFAQTEQQRIDQITQDAVRQFVEGRSASAADQTRPTVPPQPGTKVELTLDDAVQRALERNLDVAVERLSPQTYDFALAALNASYRPTFTSTYGLRNQST